MLYTILTMIQVQNSRNLKRLFLMLIPIKTKILIFMIKLKMVIKRMICLQAKDRSNKHKPTKRVNLTIKITLNKKALE